MINQTKIITIRLPLEVLTRLRSFYDNKGIIDLTDSQLVKFFVSSQSKNINDNKESEVTKDDLLSALKEKENDNDL